MERMERSHPIDSVDQLLAWQPSDYLNRAIHSRHWDSLPPRFPQSDRPQLLVCHDFKGGYHDYETQISIVDETQQQQLPEPCPLPFLPWKFREWMYVDVFIYFSHHFVSIPPIGYMDIANKYGGVEVLGTVMFEHDNGLTALKQILDSNELQSQIIQKLVEIANCFHFQGWFLNVEVGFIKQTETDCPEKVVMALDYARKLMQFIKQLTTAVRASIPAGRVIWYDAITRQGLLRWQDELNDENVDFLQSCDGIFLNYFWKEVQIEKSALYQLRSCEHISRSRVFVGVDIWGRGSFGGGGFEASKALRVIREHGFSAAIFAPAWTCEKAQDDKDAACREYLLWNGCLGVKSGLDRVTSFVSDGHTSHPLCGILDFFEERPVILQLPFATRFCPGYGCQWFVDGARKHLPGSFYNLSLADTLPASRLVLKAGDSNAVSTCLDDQEAFSASHALRIHFQTQDSFALRLFRASCKTKAFKVVMTYKSNVPVSIGITDEDTHLLIISAEHSINWPGMTHVMATTTPCSWKESEETKQTQWHIMEAVVRCESISDVIIIVGDPCCMQNKSNAFSQPKKSMIELLTSSNSSPYVLVDSFSLIPA